MSMCVGIGLCLALLCQDGEGQDFRDHVAPVLEKRCVHCHGGVSPKGNLSLTTARGVFKGGDGGPAVVAGKPEESPLLEMISGDPPEMPKNGAPLSMQEVAQIRGWIEQGAQWPAGLVLKDRRFEGQRWWSFQPLRRPAAPVGEVKSPGWARTPIDVSSGQARAGRARAQPGGRPPHPDPPPQLRPDRPAADPRGDRGLRERRTPRRLRALVERLLGSPHYGERWGRHWLDVVHYGDTHGYDKDKRRDHAWPYRDYVIRAFNDDLPYGQFIREQVAGDVLEPGDPGRDRHGVPRRRPVGFRRPRRAPRGNRRQAQGSAHRPRRHAFQHHVNLREPDRPLRALPRPQVRPDRAERLLRPAGRLRRARSGRPAPWP